MNALTDLGEAKILAVVTNSKDYSNASVETVDIINTYYGRGETPIGTDKDGAKVNQSHSSPYTLNLIKEFKNDVECDNQMPDSLDIYRSILAS